MGYTDAIVKATGRTAEEACVIEELIRAEVPTLDHLSAPAFDLLARGGADTFDYLRGTDPECFAWYVEQAGVVLP